MVSMNIKKIETKVIKAIEAYAESKGTTCGVASRVLAGDGRLYARTKEGGTFTLPLLRRFLEVADLLWPVSLDRPEILLEYRKDKALYGTWDD